MIKYYDRKSKSYKEENIAGSKALKWTYESPLGKGFLELFIKRKIFSKLYGHYCDSSLSKKKIKKFIDEFNINMNRFEKKEYKSFNDFFYRKLQNNIINESDNILISPADSRLLVMENINKDRNFNIKYFQYNLEQLIQSKELANKYDGGTALVFRLCPTDYHRFHFIDNGVCNSTKKIKGYYYSVNPIALKNVNNVFIENKREYSIFKSENFGDILYMEVGATCVGGIIQTYNPNEYMKRGMEKGYFKFGGSTVILIFEKNKILIDEDIIRNSNNEIETYVTFGEKIGRKL